MELLEAVSARHSTLRDVEFVHIHTEGSLPFLSHPEAFRSSSLFVGANIRHAVNDARMPGISAIPAFLSEVPRMFRENVLPLDVALVSVSPPDAHGFVSLGMSVDCSMAAVECSATVVGVINANVPRTHGDSFVHISEIDVVTESSAPLVEMQPPPVTEVERAIGRHCASLIPDGATLQLGIGAMPNAVLGELGNHAKLGVHSEMISDGVIDLVNAGVITGERKSTHPGKVVTSFAVGSKRLAEEVDDNPLYRFLDCSYVNDPRKIARNDRVCAINGAVSVDLTGQVNADSVGSRLISGTGGQLDFFRAAADSQGGMPIVAMTSRSKSGASRIVPTLLEGAGVVTTRSHIRFVVTEFGIAEMYGKNVRERAEALAAIAHPDDREALFAAAAVRFGKL